MISRQISSSLQPRNFLRNAQWISAFFSLLFLFLCFGMLVIGQTKQFGLVGAVFLALLLSTWLLYRGVHEQGVALLMGSLGIFFATEPLLVIDASISNAILALTMLVSIGLLTLPRTRFGRVLTWSSISAILAILLDQLNLANRVPVVSSTGRWILTSVVALLFAILLIREFLSLDVRTKIILGILATGGVALGIFAAVGAYQTATVTNSLSNRLETSVTRSAEEKLINTVSAQAAFADQSFKDVLNSVQSFGQNWVSLQSRKELLNNGIYWDAAKGLIQLDNGNYSNLITDVSSLYVPNGTEFNEELVADMNTSAYLDFYAPTVLEKYPSLLAIYAIDTRGIIRYYPNINLASVLSPGFDATQRPYYLISSPLFNPKRLPRWTIPYDDAAGGGLVVTVASPVYMNNKFVGVVAADMQLSTLTQQINSLTVGKTGYAFMIDDAGHILSMPANGYQLFGLNQTEITPENFVKVSVLGIGSPELRAATSRMAAGGSGLLKINEGGVDYYISFAPITANGYSLALVVPVEELQTDIINASNETASQLQAGTRASAGILVLMLVIAVFVSLWIGRVIAAPIIRLTHVANEIVEGNLTARANVTSNDEIGTLADAFNTMTSRLRETLQDLELRVEERTSQLSTANEKNERRARQFEAISQVASTISSTRDLNTLLEQVTIAISTRFGFYHVGVFLLDPRREYAVLSAANSTGGKKMLARQHRLRVGETGLVGFVTSTGKPRLALDTVEDVVYFNNPDLPDTHSEIALPLIVEDEVIGALDVQSTATNAFDQEDVNILTALADQVAIAIQNSRQYDQTRKALAEADALSRQFVQVGWKQFTKTQNLVGVHHSGAKATLVYADQNNGKETFSLKPEQAKGQRGAFLSLPVKLRGEVIGSVDVRSPDNQNWDQDDLDVVTAIIERAAIAMENARLLAESQKRAAKERTIGEISAKISAQSDIDELLKTAVQELNRTLPGSEIAIQFNNQEEAE